MAFVKNVFFKTPGFELNIPDWEFPDYGLTSVWGASGAGKTTLLNVLSGLVPCPSLNFQVNQKRVEHVGFVFQDFALFPHMTARENILFPAKARKLSEEKYSSRFMELSKKLELSSFLEKKAQVLSGGEKQRVGLARALVIEPEIVLLDEPLSSIDEKIKNEARELIVDLSQTYHVPFLWVTHDLRDARLCHDLLILEQGRKLASGATSPILDDPESLELARLIPENQVLDVKISNGEVRLAGVVIEPERKKKSSQLALVCKNWDIQVIKKERPLFPIRVLNHIQEGPNIRYKVKLSDGQVAFAFGPIDQDVREDQMDLNINKNSLILFTGDRL